MSFRIAFLTSLIASTAPSALQAGTVAFWTFQEGAPNLGAVAPNSIFDSVDVLHGSPTGAPIYRTVSLPGSTLALEFDGSNDRVAVADDSKFRLTQSLTLEATVQPFSMATDVSGALIVFRGDRRPGKDAFHLRMLPNNHLEFVVSNEIDGALNLVSPNPLTFTRLQHVAGTLDDSTGVARLYIDGNEVASAVTSIRAQGILDPFSVPGIGIGSLNVGGQYFHGLIDDVRISDMALSPNEFTIPVPEPSSLVLLASGLIGICLATRRRRKGTN